jgi:hypothetical protein
VKYYHKYFKSHGMLSAGKKMFYRAKKEAVKASLWGTSLEEEY